ncbi:uncharacterized protein LOC132198670 [Neocloeon triangulifer]|uniref:uncharacterized protein LOC132198670 n=1 Tax=Neocloeon triangulifer TaxID=2078957 RepID=UPI00286EE4AC|nr:uncharacterized protein LOC132198670 [Neocloeon triangulifer]
MATILHIFLFSIVLFHTAGSIVSSKCDDDRMKQKCKPCSPEASCEDLENRDFTCSAYLELSLSSTGKFYCREKLSLLENVLKDRDACGRCVVGILKCKSVKRFFKQMKVARCDSVNTTEGEEDTEQSYPDTDESLEKAEEKALTLKSIDWCVWLLILIFPVTLVVIGASYYIYKRKNPVQMSCCHFSCTWSKQRRNANNIEAIYNNESFCDENRY